MVLKKKKIKVSPKGGPFSTRQKLKTIQKTYEILSNKFPDPKCELEFKTPYQLLVSVVLSAQATDKMVNKVMTPIYEGGFGVEDAKSLGIEGILKKIKQIGLAPTKAKNVYNLSLQLIEKHGGKVPNTRDELESLPGVGRKTASVILGELFGEPTLAVDTHVYRTTFRLGLHKETTPLKAEKVLLSIVDKKYLPKAHHLFILLGRYTCKALNPQCDACHLSTFCPSNQTTKK